MLESGRVEMHFVGTEDQIADIFTRPLAKERFERFGHELGMRSGSLSHAILLFVFPFLFLLFYFCCFVSLFLWSHQ